MLQHALFSSARDDWETPAWLFRALDAEFRFTLDPCATHQNAKCKLHFTKQEDGLRQDWGDHTVFMNPPYGRQIGRWMKKATSPPGAAPRWFVLCRPGPTPSGGTALR